MSDKMELRLVSPTEEGFLRKIEWNRQEIEEKVRQKVKDYDGLVYTEDTMKDAKKDLAELRRLVEGIEDRRKLVKKKVMEPYDTFEGEVKEVVVLIQKPINLIDGQVKAYEKKVKEEKKGRLLEEYAKHIGELKEILPFDKVFNERYLNVSFSENKAKAEIKASIEKVATDLETIDSLDSKYKLNVKDVYIRTLDLSKALAENTRLLQLEEKMEADRRRKEEEAKKRQEAEELRKEEQRRKKEEKAAQEAEKQSQTEKTTAPEDKVERQEEDTKSREEMMDYIHEAGRKAAEVQETRGPEEKKYRATFSVVGTLEQLLGLKQYMKENGISFGKAGEKNE